MSLFPPSRELITPSSPWEWRKPRDDVLKERVFPAGRPPFHYFPSVRTILNFTVCPVAGIHECLYGIDSSYIDYWTEEVSGRLFEKFVSTIKYKFAINETVPSLHKAKEIFTELAGDIPGADECWRAYASKWFSDNLQRLEAYVGKKLYFQVHCLTRIILSDWKYPLHGQLDELNTTDKEIVEITILPEAYLPLKSLQVWLYWRMLSSVPQERRPDLWKEEDFENYRLFIETPYGKFEVKKDNPEYEKAVHEAYAWLSALTSAGDTYEVARGFSIARKFCLEKGEKPLWCKLDTTWCLAHTPKYPLARKAFHREISGFYRNLMYEQMWKHHLFLYQMLYLDPEELSGKVTVGKVLRFDGKRIIIDLSSHPSSLLEAREDWDIFDLQAIFGTVNLGLYREIHRPSIRGRELEGEVENGLITTDTDVCTILLPEVAIYRESPWFLLKMKQRMMRNLDRRRGADREEKAKQEYVIRFIEASFGTQRLIGKREDAT